MTYEAPTILMTVKDRPEFNRDLGLAPGRAMNRIIKRAIRMNNGDKIRLTCGEGFDSFGFHAIEVQTPTGLARVLSWLHDQAHLHRYNEVTPELNGLLSELRALSRRTDIDITDLPFIDLDMDGLFADFDLAYPTRFKHHHLEVDRAEMWEHLATADDFYYTIPLMPHAYEFYHSIRGFQHGFLSATRNSLIGRGKQHWLDEVLHVPKGQLDGRLIAVDCGNGTTRCKSDFIIQNGQILIDDYAENIKRWEARGGVGIAHTDFTSTARSLLRHLKAAADKLAANT